MIRGIIFRIAFRQSSLFRLWYASARREVLPEVMGASAADVPTVFPVNPGVPKQHAIKSDAAVTVMTGVRDREAFW
jgi:hypothetical protein